MDDSARTRLTDDDRFDLRIAATGSQRRNRPVMRIVLSGVIFVIAALIWIVAQSGLSSAKGDLQEARARTTEIAEVLGELDRLQSTESQVNLGPDDRATLKIQDAFKRAGLTIDLPTAQSPTGSGQWRYRTYAISKVETHEIDLLVRALGNSLGAVDGLTIDVLELTAHENKGWEMKVTFMRPEVSS